jgi:ABC-type uncharacterized transport system involved in gliding motility auxiliary subunit
MDRGFGPTPPVTPPDQSRPDDRERSRPAGASRARDARREGGKTIAALLLAAGAIVSANLAAARLALRFDLTEDHVYTLSPASRDLVRALPDELTIKAYFSRDLPPALDGVARYTRELLEEYRLASGGKLRYEAADPADPGIEEQAGRCHIGKVAIQSKSSARFAVGAYFMGLCLWYDGKSRALTPIERETGLEYEISALIKRMSQKRQRVAFTVGHGERDLGLDYTFVKRALDPELEVVTLDPTTGPLADDVALLIVAGPRRPFEERARREVERFLAGGRPAIFLLDGATVETDPIAGSRRVVPTTTGLEPLLGAYGFRVGNDLVFDPRNVPGPLEHGAPDDAPMFVNFPAFVAVRPEPALARQLPVTAGIDAVVFPFASSIDLVGPLAGSAAASGSPAPSSGHIWALARSSSASWRQTGSFSLTAPAAASVAPEGALRGSSALAYAYQGPARASALPAPASSPRPVRLVVVGDADFASDRYMALLRTFPIYAGGAQLLLNAVSWTMEDSALVALRGNVLRGRPLDIDIDAGGGGDSIAAGTGGGRAALLKWGNVAGVPLLVCLAGLLRWRWRSPAHRRRQRLSDGREGPR